MLGLTVVSIVPCYPCGGGAEDVDDDGDYSILNCNCHPVVADENENCNTIADEAAATTEPAGTDESGPSGAPRVAGSNDRLDGSDGPSNAADAGDDPKNEEEEEEEGIELPDPFSEGGSLAKKEGERSKKKKGRSLVGVRKAVMSSLSRRRLASLSSRRRSRQKCDDGASTAARSVDDGTETSIGPESVVADPAPGSSDAREDEGADAEEEGPATTPGGREAAGTAGVDSERDAPESRDADAPAAAAAVVVDEPSDPAAAAAGAAASPGAEGAEGDGTAEKAGRRWREYTEANTGFKYYSDGVTTRWDKPAGFVPSERRRRRRGWREYVDEGTGRSYYSDGARTTWDRPEEFRPVCKCP